MAGKNNETQKAVDFRDMYYRIEQERARIGFRTFAETVRYICAKHLDGVAAKEGGETTTPEP
jgi:hypothetical protein